MLDLHGCMMIYGIGSICGAIFVILVLKDTSGISLDDVGIDENTKQNQIFHVGRINSI